MFMGSKIRSLRMAAFDLESVLTPEIWKAVAAHSRVEEFGLTTRDSGNYGELMRHRMRLCREHGYTLAKLREVVADMSPFSGAADLIGWLQQRMRVVILSDTFYELAQPLLGRLRGALALCHHLRIDAEGYICGYRLWSLDAKREAVKSFRRIGYEVRAVGDSYNDLNMLKEADRGCFFSAREELARKYPQFPKLQEYEELRLFLDPND